MTPEDVIQEQYDAVTSLADWFDEEIKRILAIVAALIIARLVSSLLVRGGSIVQTSKNVVELAKIDKGIQALLQEHGLDEKVSELATRVNDQRKYFDLLVKATFGKKPRGMSKESLDFIQETLAVTVQNIYSEVIDFSSRARRIALLSIGSDFRDLKSSLMDLVQSAAPRVRSTVINQATEFYRGVAAVGFDAIENVAGPLRYVYSGPGPLDPKIRPFCKHLMVLVWDGVTWSRAQIDNLDNGQMPNVFVTCGGKNCRHQWRPVK
jgi:hypothetical protein